jgi:hypothetical protein
MSNISDENVGIKLIKFSGGRNREKVAKDCFADAMCMLIIIKAAKYVI